MRLVAFREKIDAGTAPAASTALGRLVSLAIGAVAARRSLGRQYIHVRYTDREGRDCTVTEHFPLRARGRRP